MVAEEQPDKLFLNLAEAAHYIGIKPVLLNKLAKRGTIKSVILGKRRYYTVNLLREFAALPPIAPPDFKLRPAPPRPAVKLTPPGQRPWEKAS